MRRSILFFCFLLLLTDNAFSQKDVNVFFRPKEYDSPTGQILPTHQAKRGELFTVMSDRDENPVYETAAKENPSSRRLKFLEPFYVIGEDGAFFKLAEYDDNNIKGNVLKSPKVIGFVEKSRLILWKRAIRNQTGFVKKALAVVKGEVLVEKEKFISKDGQVKCFSSPSQSSKYALEGAGVKLFRFLYVCKEDTDAKMVLLASSSSFNILTKSRLLGWVSNDIVQLWEDRLCLEPNFDDDAIAERKRKGVSPTLLVTLDGAKQFKADPNSVGADTISLESVSGKRWEPYRKRMPVLNYLKDVKICETGYTTPIVNAKGIVEVEDTTWERLGNDIHTRKALLRNINIVFVIDGSSALSPYLSSVTNAISSLNRDLNSDRKNLYKVKYGAVIYRNYEDASCPGGDASISKSNLTNQYQNVLDFVDRQRAIQGCNDPVIAKALYKGLLEGFSMFDSKLGKNESNYVILIGGAGESPADKTKNAAEQQKLIELYSRVNINMFVYQYRKIANPAYLAFQPQIVDIMRKGNDLMLANGSKFNEKGEVIEPVEWEEEQANGYFSYNAVENENFVKYAEITWPQVGNSIGEDIFLKEMDGFLGRITTKLNDYVDAIDLAFVIGQKVNLTNAMRVLLSGVQTKTPPSAIIESFKGENYQFFGRCYAPMTSAGLSKDLFQRVLFFTDDELSDLSKVLDQLTISLDDVEQTREQLKKALIEIATGYVGKNEAKEMPLDKLLAVVVGKEPNNRIFYSIKSLEDIGDSKTVKDETIKEIAKQLAAKADQLRRIKADDSYRYKEDADLVYYWVPEKFLP